MGGCFLSFFLSLFVPSGICVTYLINLLFPLTVVSSVLPPALLFLPITRAAMALNLHYAALPATFLCLPFPASQALKL